MNFPVHRHCSSRRIWLRQTLGAGLLVALARRLPAQAPKVPDWTRSVLKFLETCRRKGGGYGWPGETDPHLTPTHAASGCYQLLGLMPPDKATVANYVRTNHPLQFTRPESPLHNFDLQQIQALRWLDEQVSEFAEQVRRRTKPYLYPATYEQHRFPILQMELTAFLERELLGLPTTDLAPDFVEYLESRCRANGSFNNTPAADGSDGHILNTWWGVQAMRALGRGQEKAEQTVAWVRACQLANGGFTYQPKPVMAAVDNVAYTRAAARLLKHFGATPNDRAGCLKYLHSLWNDDGGFGDRPGWLSNPVAAYYALDALVALGALEEFPAKPSPPAPRRRSVPALPANLKIFTIQIEAHGQGSTAEAVELARALRIHLWGAKNSRPGWIARAQALADQRKVPVKFFVANEEYGTFVTVPGMGTYSHTSDVIVPTGVDFGASLASQGPVSWEEFRARRLAPLEKAGGRLIWQFGENEELVRLYLDDSLARGGFAAISTFHFGNPDFTISQPFLQQYRGQFPYIALQDAHGQESWWWGDMLAGFRTLFLAPEPTWDAWLQALKNDWVVAVRHDAVTGFKTRLHGGAPGLQELIRAREAEWRWWGETTIERPPVSVVVVWPQDEFEDARPKEGLNIRVRCQWENTKQGQPKEPVTELVKLTLDGRAVEPELVATKAKQNKFSDYYHLYRLPNPVPGRHTVTATVRRIKTGAEIQRTVEFEV